jgi:SAM-dependent methyltransferase
MDNGMSLRPNRLGAEYWNEDGGRSWVENMDRTEALLRPLSRQLFDAAAPAPGERVLDVGCGGAATSRELARRVAPAGQVLGVDVSAPILDTARSRSTGITNLELRLADAGTAKLGHGHFDLAVSRFGVMFFDDPIAAFSNLRRSLRPGGRMVFLCWRPLEENVWMAAPGAAAAALLPPPAEPPDPDAPGPFALGDPGRVRHILAGAGFETISLEPLDEPMRLGTLSEALDYLTRMGPVGKLLRDADPVTVDRVGAAVRAVLASHDAGDGVSMPGAAWLVRARRAG